MGRDIGGLLAGSHRALDDALELCEARGWTVAGIVGLFSGGDDSTALAHMFRGRVTHFGTANTSVGIEATRQYVRDTCAGWRVPLLERGPGWLYEDMVLGAAKSVSPRARHPVIWRGGFPGGTKAHATMFNQLKGRAFRKIRNELIAGRDPRKHRVIYLSGVRRDESKRRARSFSQGYFDSVRQDGSVLWCSVLADWSKLDLNEYRRQNPGLPRNEVSATLHMSGECLCGCFTRPGELDELRYWPQSRPAAEYLADLARILAGRGLDIDPKTLNWGWNSDGKCATGLCNN